MLLHYRTVHIAFAMVCAISANKSTSINLQNSSATVMQLKSGRIGGARQARVLDTQPDTEIHAEHRNLEPNERLQQQHNGNQDIVQDLVTHDVSGSANTTEQRISEVQNRYLEDQRWKGSFDNITAYSQKKFILGPAFARKMDDSEKSVFPVKEIKSKPLHFGEKNQDINDFMLYRPKSRSRNRYQRSRILVQKNTRTNSRSSLKPRTAKSVSTDISGKMQEAHRGKSLSTELVGMVSGLTPEVMHVETRVLPDIFVLPTSKENSKEQYPLGEHPRWTTVLPDTRTTHFDIRLAKEMLHGKLKEGDHSLPVEVRFKHKQYDHTKESKENIEPRSEDRVLLSPHNRATSGRSLFKILAGQQQNSDPNESSGKNQTSSATTEKENKMSPFRFGLQQLFTPRLPVALPAYPQMITYAPQYSAGSLLYPTRAPLLPLYTTTALLPAAAHAARPAPEISPTRMPQQHPAASSIVKAVETTTVAASPDECPGDCVDVFAALMCGQVDEEARCVLSNQRCCVGGTEQVTKFLKRHGSLTKKKKKHSKKYQKNIQHNKESITAATDNGAENANTVKIAVEEGGHLKNTRDVQKILIHSTSTTSSAFSKGDTTKEPAIIQLSSGNGVLQVIGSKDQLWTTRYPNIPKYVTIVTTTRRPHKPQREHATRRMDLYPDDRRLGSTVIYKAENSSPNKGAEITHEELEELARNTKSSKHQKNDCGDVDEVDKDDSEPGRDGIHESVPILAAELDIIKSGAHEVKVRQPYKRKHQKMEAQKCNIRKQAHGNHINDNGKNQDLHDEGVTVDTVYDTELDPSSGQAERTEEQLPACPGNCVLPLFSLFCQPESKTAHVCTAPGRVCCVGASTGPSSVEKSEPASETTENPAQAEAEETINADESHDQECNGRCVAALFQYTCRHPLKITHDICPSGSLCCTKASEAIQTQDHLENDGVHPYEETTNEDIKESNNHLETTQNEVQGQQNYAAESAKNKLSLIHNILSTVLSTKQPKITSDKENVSGDLLQRYSFRPGGRLRNFTTEPIRSEETKIRFSFAAPYEPKYFPTESRIQGSSASEESSDPSEVIIEPAVPARPALDTRFSQLDHPPSGLGPATFTLFNNPTFHRYHKTPIGTHKRPKQHGINLVSLRHSKYPRPLGPARLRASSLKPGQRHNQRIKPNEHQDGKSRETMPMRPPYMRYMRYPPVFLPYRRLRTPPPPEFLKSNSNVTDADHTYTFGNDLTTPTHEETNHLYGSGLFLENAERMLLPQKAVSSTTEIPLENNLNSPFVSEWTPVDVNVARVKEVNSISPAQSEELFIRIPKGNAHPSPCGLNGFHIKRGLGGQGVRTAKQGEWCWQAAIVDSDDRLLCSGAVIGAQWILTSASCLVKANFTSPISHQTSGLRAKIGYVDLADSEKGFTRGPVGSQTKTISMVYSHHNFNASKRDNDIALLKLHDFIDLNGVVCVICLPSTIRPERAIKNCTVTAYRTELRNHNVDHFGATGNSNVSIGKLKLIYERVSKIDPQVCSDLGALRNASVFPSNGSSMISVSRSKFCAGNIDKAERTATCKISTASFGTDFDKLAIESQPHLTEQEEGVTVIGLGNPLVCRIDDEFYQLSGLSSVFLGCSNPASPTVFTNLAYYTGWINQIANVNRYP